MRPELEKLQQTGEQASGDGHTDLSHYAYMFNAKPTRDATTVIIDQLHRLTSIEPVIPTSLIRCDINSDERGSVMTSIALVVPGSLSGKTKKR